MMLGRRKTWRKLALSIVGLLLSCQGGNGIAEPTATGGTDLSEPEDCEPSGEFGAWMSHSLGGYSLTVLAPELDGDATPELIVTVGGTNQLVVFSGAEDTPLVEVASYDTPDKPTALAVGDIDGTGLNDVLVGGESDGSIATFLARGDGTLEPGQTIELSSIVGTGFRIAMFEDLGAGPSVVLTNNSNVVVLSLRGAVEETPAQVVPLTGNGRDLAIRDFDEDGILDIAVATATGIGLSILWGVGDGTLEIPVVYDLQSSGVASAWDSAADGLLLAHRPDPASRSNEVWRLYPEPGRTWSEETLFEGNNLIFAMSITDVDLDGVQDIILVDGGWLEEATPGGLLFLPPSGPAIPLRMGTGPSSAVIADFNGDGLPDLATADNVGGTLTRRFQNCRKGE